MDGRIDAVVDDPPGLQDETTAALLAECYGEARRAGRSYVEVAVQVDDTLSVLEAWQKLGRVFYWTDRRGGETVLAAGVAEEFSVDAPFDATAATMRGLKQIEASCADGVRYYGGMRFDPSAQSSAEWSAFRAVRFFKPRYELRVRCDQSVLRIVVDDRDVEGELALMTDRRSSAEAGLSFTRTRDLPDHSGWTESISTILAAIRRGDIEKAVLARAVELQAKQAVDPVALFRQIVETTPACYHVFFQPDQEAAFLSATPERLFVRHGCTFRSEAVAGTRPRSSSSEDDLRLRDELMASDKDRREHAVVGRSIMSALQPFASNVDIDRLPSEMRLTTGRHLKSTIRAQLRPSVSSASLLSAIHPTPAVGGHPTADAVQMLRRIEPFDRGWYSGAIGWIGAGEAELAVGIRSALVTGDIVRLYSGAGIVEGSEADAEWDEIEQKIEGFLRVLGVSG